MPILSVRQFAPLMRQRVTIAPKTGSDSFGEETYGAAVTYQCAVVGEMRMVMDQHGQQAPSRQTCYLMSNAAVRPEDLITLSTGDVGSTESYAINPLILAVGRFPFLAGQYATVIYLK